MFKVKNDSRITKLARLVRRTRIDLLLELLNVLKSDMLTVVAITNLPEEVAKFSLYKRRKIVVKPWLTCYWQLVLLGLRTGLVCI